MTLPLPKTVLDQHTVILGKTRSGKSSTMRLLVERLLDDKKPVCIIDPKGDWWGIKSSADGKRAGYEVVIFGGKHADVPINQHSGKVVGELVATGNRPALIDLGGWMVGERTRFFIDFASTLFTRTHGHRWLCIDEAHNFAPQGKVHDPDAGMSLHWANRLASEGAGKGVVLVSASQRPQKVHKDYLTSHETLIAKRVIHPLDRGAMKDWIDGCGDPAKGKEVLDSLAGLQRSEGWVWSPEIDFGPKRVTFPMFSTYDSFAVQTGAADRKLKGWASVDLDEVKSKLASVVEEARANDPKALRAEVTKLKAELAKVPRDAGKLVASAAKDAITAAEKRGFEQARKKFGPAVDRAFKKHFSEMLSVVDRALVEMRNEVGEALLGIKGTIPGIEIAFEPSAAPAQQIARPAQQKMAPVQRPAAAALAGDGSYTGPQMKVLRSLAMWLALGHPAPTREMVAAVAGYKPSTGNYNNLIGGLVTAGTVGKPGTGLLSLQVSGIADMTADEGREMLVGTLSGPQRKIVAALIGAGAKSREQLAADTGYQPSTGNFNNLLGSLNTIGVTHKPAQGHVALSDWAQELLNGYEMRLAA
jgi:hypothetical protein